MNARFLITLLQVLPQDSEVRISFYDQQYEDTRQVAVSSIKFCEEWKIKEKDGSQKFGEPNRVILS